MSPKKRSQVRVWGKKYRKFIISIVTYILLIAGAIVFLIPLFWMISTSLKEQIRVLIFPPQWVPNPVRWSNYVEALTIFPFLVYFKNTLIVVALTSVGELLCCSMIAYSFARLRYPGRDIFFFIAIGTMMLPLQITMIPLYIIYAKLGWIDTLKPLIIPSFFGFAFYIFLLRQFFMTIPPELDDAAKIDGCSFLVIFWRIVLPLSKPALVTILIFNFVRQWNAFLWPLIVLNSETKRTIALGLAFFRGQTETITALHLLMAASVVAVIPCFILFVIAQRYFIRGIVITGVKG